MKEVTDRWLRAWGVLLIAILGIPTFGYTWIYLSGKFGDQYSSFPKSWKLIAVEALEPWLHFWRGAMLLIAGFLTLGYTWSLMASLEEPLFTGLRKRYTE